MTANNTLLDFEPKKILSEIVYTSGKLKSKTGNITDQLTQLNFTDGTSTLTMTFGSAISQPTCTVAATNRVALDLPLKDYEPTIHAIEMAKANGKLRINVVANGVDGITITIVDQAGITI